MEINIDELAKYPLAYALSSLHSDDAKDIAHECNVLLIEHMVKTLSALEAKLHDFFKDEYQEYDNSLHCYISDNDIVDIEARYKEIKVDGHYVRYSLVLNVNSMRVLDVVKYNPKSFKQYVDIYNAYTSCGNPDYISLKLEEEYPSCYTEEYELLSKLVSKFTTYGNTDERIENEENIASVLSSAENAYNDLSRLRQMEIESHYNIPPYSIAYAIVKNYYWYWQFHIKHNTPRQYMYKNFESFVRNFWTEKDYKKILKKGEEFTILNHKPVVEVLTKDNVDNYLSIDGKADKLNNVRIVNNYDDNDTFNESDITYTLSLLKAWEEQLNRIFK